MQISDLSPVDLSPEVNIIGRKVRIASVNGAGGSGSVLGPLLVDTLRKFLGSNERLDWLKIDSNVAKIITVQDYKHKKTSVNGQSSKASNL